MRETLTDVKVRQAKAPTTGRRDLWDALVPGLSLRVTASGAKSWTVVARLRGKVVRHKLGGFPAMSLAQARDKARESLEAFQEGKHPNARRGLSSAEAWALYFKDHRAGEEHKRALGYIWAKYLEPRFGGLPPAEIQRSEAAALFAEIARTKPVQALHTQSALSHFLAWAVDRGLLEVSPIVGLRPPVRKRSRDRVYTDPELRAIWTVTGKLSRYGTFVRLLLATAQRRSHVWKIDWNQVDLSRRLWTAPTKAGRLFPCPLSPLALSLLGEPGEGRLFPARPDWSALASAVRGGDGVPADFRFHDLRRTAATRMAELGVKREVVDAVLDHAAGGVTGIYNRYAYVEEMRQALEAWGDRLRVIVTGGEQPR